MRTHQLQTMTAQDADESHEYSLFYYQGQNTAHQFYSPLKLMALTRKWSWILEEPFQ